VVIILAQGHQIKLKNSRQNLRANVPTQNKRGAQGNFKGDYFFNIESSAGR
jgi:hypothetical protein